ncbi:MAG: hypothetical protein J7K45_00790 [Thaumarchaeota archaeon]|nr:hypothetical protein [Nitrososphaerota archaeon]
MLSDMDRIARLWDGVPTLGLMLSTVKVEIKGDVPPVSLPNLEKGLKEGSVVDLPFWLAEILRDEGFAELRDLDLSTELFKALSRERLQGEFQLSTLDPLFLTRLRRELKRGGPLAVRYKDLVTIRAGKVTRLAGLMPGSEGPKEKMGLEERMLFSFISEAVGRWKEVMRV